MNPRAAAQTSGQPLRAVQEHLEAEPRMMHSTEFLYQYAKERHQRFMHEACSYRSPQVRRYFAHALQHLAAWIEPVPKPCWN